MDRRRPEAPEELEELEDEVREENPDRTTRREALELELMAQDRSELGPELSVADDDPDDPDVDTDE